MFYRRSECHRYKRWRSAESSRISNVRRQFVECEQWQWRHRRRRIHISSYIQRHRRCTKRLAQSISILNYQNMKPLAIFFLLISLCLASIVMVYTLFLLPCARFFIFRYSFVVVCLFVFFNAKYLKTFLICFDYNLYYTLFNFLFAVKQCWF